MANENSMIAMKPEKDFSLEMLQQILVRTVGTALRAVRRTNIFRTALSRDSPVSENAECGAYPLALDPPSQLWPARFPTGAHPSCHGRSDRVTEQKETVAICKFGTGAVTLNLESATAWVVQSSAEIPADLRSRAFASHSKDFRYFELIEKTLSDQFDFRFVIMRDSATLQWAIQPIFFVDQDLLAGLPRSVKAFIALVRKRFPRFFKLRMLMIGCASGEGQLDHAEHWIVPALQQAIDLYRKIEKPSVILFKDFPSSYRAGLDSLSDHGYKRVPSLPAAILPLDFKSFEEFTSRRLSKTFRKSLRRKFKDCESAAPITMEVTTEVSDIIDEIFPLYSQIFRRSKLQFEELNEDYFLLMASQMPDRVRYFVWRQNGRIIAFNLCLVHEGTIYDLDIGLDYSVALKLHLYFITWRDVVEWCLKNGVHTYHAGPLNYDPKAHLRFTLVPQDLYARHNSAILNPFFKLAIRYLEPTRHEPILQKFHNAHEL